MRRRVTNLELTLAGFLLLALITFFNGFRADNDQAIPTAESRPLETSIKPQVEGRDLLRPKRKAQVSETPAPVNQVATASATASSEESDGTTLDEAVIPIVFGNLSPELNAKEWQPHEIDFLRERFVELMSGSDQDPASPEYRRRWDDAQRQIDEEFMAFFGQEVFNEQQVKAVRAAGEESGS